ncbi:GNAT family N-acetyltransferase [Fimbriimonas ginsengisoli]|uniref:Acetyltransferase, GNAT family n=1 Tax=Fimbriimonas ginsengisoli Gsoil 348 TaxID=661478 RepID=A0A068NR91_FIMGI|nr:GNAT family N-acetyltransferase [Fimbriimonas ginsengisoli]AIE84094.1 acetyltransferase, GNAT family [Fimbriimonas ginsengisoli Gsoil 348]
MDDLEARLSYGEVTRGDLDDLIAIRTAAMRESLELVGRFDPVRARERLVRTFQPDHTRSIDLDGKRVGFYALLPTEEGFHLDHLYILPAFQGSGVGSAVMAHLFDLAKQRSGSIRLGALKGSDSNRFYRKHGFREVSQDEWDIYYVYP